MRLPNLDYETLFEWFRRKAGLSKRAFNLNDTLRTVLKIRTSPLPGANVADRLNALLRDHWRSTERIYDDATFKSEVWEPLHRTYGDVIVDISAYGPSGYGAEK